MDIRYLNKHFRFVYSPKFEINDFPELFQGYPMERKRYRFLIGAGSLIKMIGKKNAETVQKSALNMKTDKYTLKFRKYGKIEIYVK